MNNEPLIANQWPIKLDLMVGPLTQVGRHPRSRIYVSTQSCLLLRPVRLNRSHIDID